MQHIIPHYALKRIIRKIENAHRAKWRLHYSAAWKIYENFKILFFFYRTPVFFLSYFAHFKLLKDFSPYSIYFNI